MFSGCLLFFSTVVWNGECESIEYRRRMEVIDSDAEDSF
jgi:hypothetical protein